ncbi:MAG: sulfur oxidation c-type cytochrome SoxX [Alphaproteobacteria bacterium]|nr:sulfur oxidation c-type cytochrome SoxX [Alphaproteobacteria bacterium]
MNRISSYLVVAGVLVAAACTLGERKMTVAPELIDAALKGGWAASTPEWLARHTQDETMRLCTQYNNEPPKAVAATIEASARASIKYPADGKLIGDWRQGERLAQSGYGMRFTDYPARNPTGGNCYACHQLSEAEVSYGTLGPSLLGYGKIKDFTAEAIKATYEKIYNSHAVLPCSNMPRLGANGVLTPEQIRDAVALLMSRDSPVNK